MNYHEHPPGQGSIASPLSVSEAPPHPTYIPDVFNAPAVKADQKNAANSTVASAQKSAPLPMNLVGGGTHRFAGANTKYRRAQRPAVLDAEVGTPGTKPIVSADGVRAFLVPRKR